MSFESGPQWRKYKARQIEKDLAKGRGKEWINKSKLAFIGVVEVYEKAEARLAAGLRVAPPTAAEVRALQRRSVNVQQAIFHRLQEPPVRDWGRYRLHVGWPVCLA